MSLKDKYQGLRPFFGEADIVSTVNRSKNFDAASEDLQKAQKIQLFDTSNQRTYLVATDQRVYKILDDRRKTHPTISWSKKLDSVFEGHAPQVVVQQRNDQVDNLVFSAFPDRKNLVSKELFANIDLNAALTKLKK